MTRCGVLFDTVAGYRNSWPTGLRSYMRFATCTTTCVLMKALICRSPRSAISEARAIISLSLQNGNIPLALIKRVDCDGSIRLFGNSNFLSEALIGERVRVEKFGPVALVSYRHMYIREINENGSRPLVCAIGKPSMHTERALEK